MMQAAAKATMIMAMAFMAAFGTAKSDTAVDSTRPVASPDGTKTVVVDRFTPTVDGQAERFSGKMLLRVTSTDGKPMRQRYIEASQVRVVQPPVWIDGAKVCAFSYNVSKNSNGIVYFEPETNRAVQVEFVMPARQMAASGTIEQELTSLEITEFSGTETLHTRNIPWKGGSAFPLILPPLAPFQGQPYGINFYKQVNASLEEYKSFLAANKIDKLEPEQASESFTSDESWLGLLACNESASYLVGVPLAGSDPAKTLGRSRVARLHDIPLSCAQHTAADAETSMGDSRYLTAWKSAELLQVVRESYGAESDTPETTPLMTLNVKSGAVKDEATSATAAKAPAPPAAPPAE